MPVLWKTFVRMPSLRLPGLAGPSTTKDEEARLATICDDIEAPYYCNGCTEGNGRRNMWIELFKQQPIYAQYLKILVLFVFALSHAFYMLDFLDVFRIFEETAISVDSRYPGFSNHDANGVRYMMTLLVEYKKNLWMSVGTMCASLATSCFFLLLLNEDCAYKFFLVLMRVIDFISFLALPLMLVFRMHTVLHLTRDLNRVLVGLSRLTDPSVLMNRLKCSVEERENLPLCSLVIERSIFPVVVIEYLLVLALITAAYIGLAYLIVYCIRHWFPHQKLRAQQRSISQRLYGPLVQA